MEISDRRGYLIRCQTVCLRAGARERSDARKSKYSCTTNLLGGGLLGGRDRLRRLTRRSRSSWTKKRKTRFIIGDKKHTEFWTKYLEKEDSNPKVKRIKFENVSGPETAQL